MSRLVKAGDLSKEHYLNRLEDVVSQMIDDINKMKDDLITRASSTPSEVLYQWEFARSTSFDRGDWDISWNLIGRQLDD